MELFIYYWTHWLINSVLAGFNTESIHIFNPYLLILFIVQNIQRSNKEQTWITQGPSCIKLSIDGNFANNCNFYGILDLINWLSSEVAMVVNSDAKVTIDGKFYAMMTQDWGLQLKIKDALAVSNQNLSQIVKNSMMWLFKFNYFFKAWNFQQLHLSQDLHHFMS